MDLASRFSADKSFRELLQACAEIAASPTALDGATSDFLDVAMAIHELATRPNHADDLAIQETLKTFIGRHGTTSVQAALTLTRVAVSVPGKAWLAALLFRLGDEAEARKTLDESLLALIAAFRTDGAAGGMLRFGVARAALDVEAVGGDDLAKDDRNAAELANAIRPHAVAFADRWARISAAPHPMDGTEPLWLDVLLADYLHKIGKPEAERTALELLGNATARSEAFRADRSRVAEWLRNWLPDIAAGDDAETAIGILPAFRVIAQAVWRDEVKLRLLEARRNGAALVVPVVNTVVTDFHSRGRTFDGRQLAFADREIARLADDAGAVVDLDVLRRGLSLLGSKLSHDVLRYEVFEAHRRYQEGERYPNILEIDGGWSGFAERLGYSPRKHMPDVRNIVYAQAHFRFRFPDGSQGNMLSYTERAAIGRNAKARVTLTLGAPLLPGYVQELREKMGQTGLIARQAQRLVPMLRQLPSFYGRPNEHGQQASFALAIVTELREHAAELAEHGNVRLSNDRLTALADRVSLPRRLIVPVVEHWTRDTGDTPAFLERIGPDRFTLGPDHAAELAFLVEAGRRELEGIKRGKVSARQRTADAPKPRQHRKRAG